MTPLFIFAGFALLVFLVMQRRLNEEIRQSREERLAFLDHINKQFALHAEERNNLLNRVMARDLNDYRQSVIVEAQARVDESEEKRKAEQMLDAAFGPEWRTEV